MAKSTRYATLICFVLMIVAVIGAYFGYVKSSPILIVLTLLPAVIYEVYRTEGESTRASSWLMLLVLVLEGIFIVFKVGFDLARYFNRAEAYIAGASIPLGDIKVLAPALMAILSIILFMRTAGIYTKWLSVIIFVVSFVLIYVIAPGSFTFLIQGAFNQAF